MNNLHHKRNLVFLLLFLTFLCGCSSKPKKAANMLIDGCEKCWSNVSPEMMLSGNVSAEEMEKISARVDSLNEQVKKITQSFDKDQFAEFEKEISTRAAESKYKDVFVAVGLTKANSNGSSTNINNNEADSVNRIKSFIKQFHFSYEPSPLTAGILYQFDGIRYSISVRQALDMSNMVVAYNATGTFSIQKENGKFYLVLIPDGGRNKSDMVGENDVLKYDEIYYSQLKFEFLPGVIGTDHSLETELLEKNLVKLTDLPTCIFKGTGTLIGLRNTPNWTPEAKKAEEERLKKEKETKELDEKLKGL